MAVNMASFVKRYNDKWATGSALKLADKLMEPPRSLLPRLHDIHDVDHDNNNIQITTPIPVPTHPSPNPPKRNNTGQHIFVEQWKETS